MNACSILVVKVRRKELSIKTDIVRRITLKWILERYDRGVVWTLLIWFRIGTSGGLF
jgi:hypothetical protein